MGEILLDENLIPPLGAFSGLNQKKPLHQSAGVFFLPGYETKHDSVRLPQRRELIGPVVAIGTINSGPPRHRGCKESLAAGLPPAGLVHWVSIKHSATPEAADHFRGL